ncbi:hypothetical protein B0J13DRAFT_638737 [Dactylonectria estremocensis]|uniref:RZ-type domain-containing protein n=1 Tax=Dactylonectria estremocensis TaxID=1079267 RepID=A0A9P9EMJ9_9HYPO|nr:hypothetical protein B0J13DRAFT_638737 [Dactylonectria estremocensis]
MYRSPVLHSARAKNFNNGPRPPRDGKLSEWKRLLNQGILHSRPAAPAVSRVFELGLEIMDGDVGAAQDAVTDLAKEAGLGFIKAVSDRHIPAATTGLLELNLWITEVKPLFRLVTHAFMANSAVLEQQVATIFNFLHGVGGSRMLRIFNYVTRLVQSWPTEWATALARMEAVELSLAVLSKLVDCNSTAAMGPGFSALVSTFVAVMEQPSSPEEDFSRIQASKYLEYLQQRQEVGDCIPYLATRSQMPATRETFVLRRDFPGHLSADGPRHDNDNANITKIKIMPTYEEIVSLRGEYLPTNDPSEWHIKGIRGRLDREFRLVREDTVGQLRDSVREMLEYARNPTPKAARQSNNNVRTYTYDSATTLDVKLQRTGGLEMVVRCNQLPAVQKLNNDKRRDWWIRCKRLKAGALVCMFDATGSMLFCTVSDTTMRSADDKMARRTHDDENEGDEKERPPPSTLSDDPDFLYVKLQLFPGVLLASFKHTLEALQQMHSRPNIPFRSLLAPVNTSALEGGIKPPQYATKAGFVFDLSSITTGKEAHVMSPQQPLDPTQLAALSSLDPTQELSLIQGPPGTGKSYTGEKIIKVLLANKNKAQMGPILCVCYTNHALDQLLEHLLDDGLSGIIRVGSGSKSLRLRNLNLRTVVQEMLRTKVEKTGLYKAEETIQAHVTHGNELLRELSACDSWKSIKNLLALDYPKHHAELFEATDDGYQPVNHKPEKNIKRWIESGPRAPRPNRPLQNLETVPLHTMTYDERCRLYRSWLSFLRDPIIEQIIRVHKDYDEEIKQRNLVRGEVDLRCLQQANIIGVTTTGLARNLDVLRKLRSKVLVCEEAGEVLEAHILTALLPSVEHAILIGDHLQLRPQIQNYELQSANPYGQKYSLDTSLFERLVQPPHRMDLRVPYSILETQRRMHPSIAELIRSTLYPSLKDAESIMNYPEVVGMKKRLFWFHHDRLEAKAESNDALGTSHSNDFEIEMTTALVSHLSKQGKYAQGDIAVITPYLGQLHRLRRRMESMFEICVNDRDLEELEALQADGANAPAPPTSLVSKTNILNSAKVIIISLVRSNPQNKCGFLRTSNRINVLLSRAQHGITVPMWQDIIRMLAANDNFGTSLELQCPRHPDFSIPVSDPDHFVQFSPEIRITAYARKSAVETIPLVATAATSHVTMGLGPSVCGEPCPSQLYCQQCATQEIASICVDFLEMKEYHEIDLDEEPCIFPDCGHFLTVSSMDGQMGMAEHYRLDENGLPTAILGDSEPFSMDDKGIQGCATCRGPFRNISRYGRIVRRAILDTATKKFITWSNAQYLVLAERLLTEKRKLVMVPPPAIFAQAVDKGGKMALPSSRAKQLQAINAFVGKGRYTPLNILRNRLTSFATKVREEEQPFQQVAGLVRYSNVRHGTGKTFRYDEAIIQVKGTLLASLLSLQCDVTIISDFVELVSSQGYEWIRRGLRSEVKLDLWVYMQDCDSLIQLARRTQHPREETQAHVIYAQLCQFSLSLRPSAPAEDGTPTTLTPTLSLASTTARLRTLDEFKEAGRAHVQQARQLLRDFPSVAILEGEIDSLETALNGGAYRSVTAEELREVYLASTVELSGTGHWYTCANGHPFTINRCGMAMEQASCPECGAPIGGQNHQSAEGVRHATEIEEIARGLVPLGIR